ncbi:MAG: hypothetical protein KKD17_02140 [Nanoarchaeota archaeon]|nr:hypothetical protein [Nanoarchaeota archaeon]
MPKGADNKKMISIDDFTQVIGRAAALQALEASRRNEALLPLAEGDNSTAKVIPLAHLYDSAGGVGISREYIDRAMETLGPSLEEKVHDVRAVGARATEDVMIKTYQQDLLLALKNAFPDNEYKASKCPHWTDYIPSIQFTIRENSTTYEKRRKFPWLKKEHVAVRKSKQLATVIFYRPLNEELQVRVEVSDPLFLRACSETLKNLEEEFKDKTKGHHYTHTYVLR